LNTEKAHNLRERSLEVIRIVKGLIEEDGSRPETDFSFYLEESALVTLGLCYEKKGNFAGGAYAPILRKLETFSAEPLRKAIKQHEAHAEKVFELDELVAGVVAKLKAKGLTIDPATIYNPNGRNYLVTPSGDPAYTRQFGTLTVRVCTPTELRA
jgi:ParB family chromosome partitioning protein